MAFETQEGTDAVFCVPNRETEFLNIRHCNRSNSTLLVSNLFLLFSVEEPELTCVKTESCDPLFTLSS